MEDKYAEAVAAMRDTVANYEGHLVQEVAAHAADVFLDHFAEFVGSDVDRKAVAKALFLATTVLVMARDNSEDDVSHLVEVADGAICDEEDCHFHHDEELDTSFLGGQIEGMEAMIAGMVGIGLAVADLDVPDFDTLDWSAEP